MTLKVLEVWNSDTFPRVVIRETLQIGQLVTKGFSTEFPYILGKINIQTVLIMSQ